MGDRRSHPRCRTHHRVGGGTGYFHRYPAAGQRRAGTPLHGSGNGTAAPTPEWLDHLPRHIGRLFREKGYIAGYIVAAQGLGILLVGMLARFGFGSILSMQNSAWGMQGFWDNMSGMGGMSAAFRFPIIFADILCILGGIVIIGGVALAIIWKKRGQQ